MDTDMKALMLALDSLRQAQAECDECGNAEGNEWTPDYHCADEIRRVEECERHLEEALNAVIDDRIDKRLAKMQAES